MACRNAYVGNTTIPEINETQQNISEFRNAKSVTRLLFGVDSKFQSNDILQNNIDHFEWVRRNKIYPNFFGRYIFGDKCLSKDEIEFLHNHGCKIAPIYKDDSAKETEEQGKILAKKLDILALELGIPEETAVFLEIADNETITTEFIKGFAKTLVFEGFTPGFKTNTDAKFSFDREFSRGMQSDKEISQKLFIPTTLVLRIIMTQTTIFLP